MDKRQYFGRFKKLFPADPQNPLSHLSGILLFGGSLFGSPTIRIIIYLNFSSLLLAPSTPPLPQCGKRGK